MLARFFLFILALTFTAFVQKPDAFADSPPPLPISVAQVLPQASGGILIGANNMETANGTGRGTVGIRKQVGKFGRIRLQVRSHDVYIDAFQVIYEDGTTASHEVDLHIPEGRTSDWVRVDASRFIDRVEIRVHANPDSEGQARIEVMGDYADGWLRDEGAKFNDGWVLLGAQAAGFVGFDTDVIPIGEHISKFSKIRVLVRDRAITLNQIRVVYGNGDEDIIPVRARIEGGGAFGPVELRDAPRNIREIQTRYRSRFIDQAAYGTGMATVEVWALR